MATKYVCDVCKKILDDEATFYRVSVSIGVREQNRAEVMALRLDDVCGECIQKIYDASKYSTNRVPGDV